MLGQGRADIDVKIIVDTRSTRTVLDNTMGLQHRIPHEIVVVINSLKRSLLLRNRSFRCSDIWAQAAELGRCMAVNGRGDAKSRTSE